MGKKMGLRGELRERTGRNLPAQLNTATALVKIERLQLSGVESTNEPQWRRRRSNNGKRAGRQWTATDIVGVR